MLLNRVSLRLKGGIAATVCHECFCHFVVLLFCGHHVSQVLPIFKKCHRTVSLLRVTGLFENVHISDQ